MITVNVVTPEGQLFSESATSLVIRNDEGEQGILKDHIPVVIAINPGYVRLKRDEEEIYVTIIGGFLEFSNNVATVIAQEADVGRDHENALKHLYEYRKQRLEENKQRTIDFTKAERDLRDEIRKINASQYK